MNITLADYHTVLRSHRVGRCYVDRTEYAIVVVVIDVQWWQFLRRRRIANAMAELERDKVMGTVLQVVYNGQ